MKYLFASDIHGSRTAAQRVKELFLEEGADFLVLCGDLLYHGPRNDLPLEYNPKAVIEILNSLADKIIAVRGNCDTEVDQMVLSFPMLSDYLLIADNDLKIYVSHGHIYSREEPLKLCKNDILVCGHTHILDISKVNNFYYLNPGSVSIPKENNPASYMVFENKEFIIKDLDKNVIKSIKL